MSLVHKKKKNYIKAVERGSLKVIQEGRKEKSLQLFLTSRKESENSKKKTINSNNHSNVSISRKHNQSN